MAGRIVLFGATGYTGELAARALVARGAQPLMVGRSAQRLEDLAARLGGLDTAVADVTATDGAAALAALLAPGDVLVSTVGPFVRWGRAALHAALDAGAHYIDSTGEPPFIRAVFDDHDAAAQALVARGATPVLAARSRERVEALAGPGDVLLCTVGPFLRWGEPGVQAALRSGAHYIDSTGEPPFIRSVCGGPVHSL